MPSNWNNWKREDYHPNFDRRSLARKKRVKYTCELCWVKQGEIVLNAAGNPSKTVVRAAHVNHDPWNARAELIILCDPCHLQFDGTEHAKNARRTYYRKKREEALNNGQLEIPFKPPRKRKKSA